jgi:hypothetical protein
MSESLDQKLAALKLGRIRQIYESWIEQAARRCLVYAECFEQLLTEELLARPEPKRPVILRYLDSSFATSSYSLIIEPLIKCDVLILDEPGYLALEPQVGPVPYESIAGRYQRGAAIITSNNGLVNWGELVGDTAPMAIIDRLLRQEEVFYLRGTSYRLRGKVPVTLTAEPELSSATSNEKV